MSAYRAGRCTCGACLFKEEDRTIFGTRGDAFVWGALVGATLIVVAALVGRIAWQALSK